MHTCVKNWTQTAGHQKPYKLRSGQPSLASLRRNTKVKQFWGLWLRKRLTGTIQQHPWHACTPNAQLKTPQETEDVVLTSRVQANLHSLRQHPVGYCAQTTELKSYHCWMPQKPSPRKQSSSQTHSQPCKHSCLVNLTQRKRSSQRTSAPPLRLPVLFFSGYQHTPALGGNETADQLAIEGMGMEQLRHICSTEKTKLLSVIKRKPSFTARLEDTTQTRTHSISCHDTNRPPSFAPEQAIADWIAISRGLA